MGSFYSTCSITDITISDGEEMVWQFMVPSSNNTISHLKRYYDENELDDSEVLDIIFEKGLFCTNESACGLYSPFGFPIFGTYNDYGRIEINEESLNHPQIKMFESFFNMDIENIMDATSTGDYDTETLDGNPLKNLDILKQLNSTHFSRPVYDSLIQYMDGKTNRGFGKNSIPWVDEICKNLDDLKNNGKKCIQKEIDLAEKMMVDKDTIFDLRLKLISAPDEYVIKQRLYIPSLCTNNFLFLFEIDSSFKEDIENHIRLIRGIGIARKLLRPSNYGSQDLNFEVIQAINSGLLQVIGEQKEKYADWYAEDNEE